eukprot:scaffold1988_cov255-Pinguiococcus_pyrenoidosus.AAC.14
MQIHGTGKSFFFQALAPPYLSTGFLKRTSGPTRHPPSADRGPSSSKLRQIPSAILSSPQGR